MKPQLCFIYLVLMGDKVSVTKLSACKYSSLVDSNIIQYCIVSLNLLETAHFLPEAKVENSARKYKIG
jgi:hypothetical protein